MKAKKLKKKFFLFFENSFVAKESLERAAAVPPSQRELLQFCYRWRERHTGESHHCHRKERVLEERERERNRGVSVNFSESSDKCVSNKAQKAQKFSEAREYFEVPPKLMG